ncbi:Uncharacterised protein [Serratia ficaria]|nr:Uncharacterised protein [Serratia ficaria]
MEPWKKSEMDAKFLSQEAGLRERIDAAVERLSTGKAVYLSHSEAEKRMALFKAKIRGRYRRGG